MSMAGIQVRLGVIKRQGVIKHYQYRPVKLPIGEYRDASYLAKTLQRFASISVPEDVKVITYSKAGFRGKRRVFTHSRSCIWRMDRRNVGSIKVISIIERARHLGASKARHLSKGIYPGRSCTSYKVTSFAGKAAVGVFGQFDLMSVNRHHGYSGKICQGDSKLIQLARRDRGTMVRLEFNGRNYIFDRGGHFRDGWYRKEFRIAY